MKISLYNWTTEVWFWWWFLLTHYSKTTGCPKKHGNSVTNSISSFQIILWFSIVLPTEKVVICISFVCYVHTLNLFMFWLHTVVLGKTRTFQYTNRVNLSVFTVHLTETLSLQSFYPFHEINSGGHKILLWLLKLGITILIHNKDDIQFVTEFPCFFWDTLYLLFFFKAYLSMS